MELTGKVKLVSADIQVTELFKKRELVITTDEQYPQHILIEFAQDKCEYLDKIKVGSEVKVDINVRGREWINPQGEAKYFNQLSGWRIKTLEGAPTFEPVVEAEPVTDNAADDLPF